MIVVTVRPSGETSGATRNVCCFDISDSRPDAYASLKDVENILWETIRSTPACLTLTVDQGTAEVTYDPTISKWDQWYIGVIDAIKSHYSEHYPRYGYEVVSILQR